MREFDQFTDAEVMRGEFQRLFPNCDHGPLRVTGCEVLHARVKPHRPPLPDLPDLPDLHDLKDDSERKSYMSALYRLEVLDSFNGQKSEQMLYAKAYLDNRSHAEFIKNMNSRLCPTGFNVAMAHLPELDTVVWCFPNDPALIHLADVTHPDNAKRYLPYQFLPPGFQRPEDLSEVKVTVVNYSPENRCLVKYEVSSRLSEETITVIGKIFPNDIGSEVYKWTEEMWRLSEQNPKFFKIPRPLSYDGNLHIVWQKGLQGVRLVDCFNNWSSRNLLQTVARGLAGLHSLSLPIDHRVTINSRIDEISKKIANLTKAFPRLRSSLKNIEHKITTCAFTLSSHPKSLIHGDFHIEQLFLCGDRIALFDFDELAIGDPLQDVADFITDLHSHPYDSEMIEAMKSALVEAYVIEAGRDIPRDRLRWHLAVHYVIRAHRSYWKQKHFSEDVVRQYLGLAQNELMKI